MTYTQEGMIPVERYYQPEIECASREQIKAWQDERLVKQVKHVWDNVPYYRKKMEEKGVTPDDIKSSDDLYKLPFVTKADLREAYPYGLVAKPLKDCVRIQSTSGTTGKRVVAFYTQHDIDLWEDCCARAIVAAGGSNEDVCQVSYTRTCARCPTATACSPAAPASTAAATRWAASPSPPPRATPSGRSCSSGT